MTPPSIEALKSTLSMYEARLRSDERNLNTILQDLRATQDRIANSASFINHYKLAIEALEERFKIDG